MKNPWIWSKEHSFATSTSEAKRVLDELLEQLAEQQWGEHDVFGVHMAVEEALMNAIKHGNQLDASKRVSVEFKVKPDQVLVRITDEGPGFDPDSVPDPTDEENLELPSGRGLMLMRSFMTSIEFNESGNSVTMAKQRTQ